MSVEKPNGGLQFSLKSMLLFTTLICLILTLPRGFILLAVGIVWILFLAGIAKVLILFKVPIYRLLSGLKVGDEGE